MARAARAAVDATGAGFIAALAVWHAPQPAPEAAARAACSDVWRVDTCQRQLLIEVADAAHGGAPVPAGFALHRGLAGYELLLRIATGLESAIPGETNVFGQLRRSWAGHCARHARPSSALTAVARALFADAATVRTRHLEGIGGTSYGTLARMLLKPRREARVLVAGTGELSKALLPAFAAFEVGIHARRPEAVPQEIARRFGPGEEQAAISWADALYVCLPGGTERDEQWVEALRARPVPAVHLGLRRPLPGPWSEVPGLRTLDELFDLQRCQSELRALRLDRAARCCRDLALVRLDSTCSTVARRA